MCNPYKFNALDLVFPSSNIFNTLCKSYDRTNMFIVAIIRIIILYIMYQLMIKHIDNNSIAHYIFIILFIIDLMNIVVILSKKPEINDETIQ